MRPQPRTRAFRRQSVLSLPEMSRPSAPSGGYRRVAHGEILPQHDVLHLRPCLHRTCRGGVAQLPRAEYLPRPERAAHLGHPVGLSGKRGVPGSRPSPRGTAELRSPRRMCSLGCTRPSAPPAAAPPSQARSYTPCVRRPQASSRAAQSADLLQLQQISQINHLLAPWYSDGREAVPVDMRRQMCYY